MKSLENLFLESASPVNVPVTPVTDGYRSSRHLEEIKSRAEGNPMQQRANLAQGGARFSSKVLAPKTYIDANGKMTVLWPRAKENNMRSSRVWDHEILEDKVLVDLCGNVSGRVHFLVAPQYFPEKVNTIVFDEDALDVNPNCEVLVPNPRSEEHCYITDVNGINNFIQAAQNSHPDRVFGSFLSYWRDKTDFDSNY